MHILEKVFFFITTSGTDTTLWALGYLGKFSSPEERARFISTDGADLLKMGDRVGGGSAQVK